MLLAATYLLRTVKQVELSHPDAELRLLEVFNHKIYKVITFLFLFDYSEHVDNFTLVKMV